MKTIPLKELNANGQVINQFKKVAFVTKSIDKPILYRKNDATKCYLHFYKNKYYVTYHIIRTIQYEYTNYENARNDFNRFVQITIH